MKAHLDALPIPEAAPASTTTRRTQHQRKALKKSCQDFEAVFLQSMFKAMRKTVPESSLFKESNATAIYRDMLDQEVATTISRRQSLGLADQLYRQMEKKLPPEK